MLHVRAVDLTGSPSQVAEEIKRLADWIATRSEQVQLLNRRAS